MAKHNKKDLGRAEERQKSGGEEEKKKNKENNTQGSDVPFLSLMLQLDSQILLRGEKITTERSYGKGKGSAVL